MFDRIVSVLTKRLCADMQATDEQNDAFQYGIEALLHTVLSTAGLILIGMLLRMIQETLIIIVVFYLNQTLGGGYHATSHLKCFATMTVFLLVGLAIAKSQLSEAVFLIVSFIAGITLLRFPLTLHEHKRYMEDNTCYLKKRSRLIVALQLCVVLICTMVNGEILKAVSIGMLLSCVSRLVAKYQSRK